MNRLQVLCVWIVSVAISVYSAVFLANEFTRVDTMVRMGDIWSLLNFDAQPLGVFTEVDPQDFLTRPLPRVGDTLLTIGSYEASRGNYFTVFNPDTPAGMDLPVTFRGGDSTFSALVRTRSIPTILKVQFILLFCLRVGITLGMLFTGIWAFVRKPFSPQVRVLSLFCFSLVSLMVLGQPTINVAYGSFVIPFQGILNAVSVAFGLLSGSFWMHLQMIFPRSRPRFLRHRGPVLAGMYLLPLVTAALSLAMPARFGLLAPIVPVLFFAAGYVLLGRTIEHVPTHLERRQARLVLWGSLPGISLLGLLSISGVVFPGWQNTVGIRLSLAVNNLLFLVLLLTPITILYAFGRYRLLEIEARVRRGTLFVVVNVVLICMLGGLVYLFGWFLTRVIGFTSTTPVVVASLGLALGIGPAQRRIRGALEDRIYPERRRLRALLRDFLASSREIADEDLFWATLDNRLREGLGTRAVYPVMPVRGKVQEPPGAEPADQAPFEVGDEFVTRICEGGRPLLLDEILASGRFDLRPEQARWLRQQDIALLMPLSTRSGALGFVAAGPKQSGDDYSPVEIEILTSLFAQVAVAAENIGLLREKLEKERLKQQLAIARGIQEGLLPRELPETPGLSIACRIIFCLDVAGDFYDVLPIGGGRTLVAAGDVSGKGVGPALLMANLQASLRAIASVSLPLADEMAGLNNLLCESTPEDFFITLFVMIFDPRTNLVRWVNAGHNPPLLLRSDGTVSKLDQGGLLLGVRRGAAYQEGVARFDEGDSILMYTDGVSEAMDSSGEEFGEARIEEFLRLTTGVGAAEAVGMLEKQVRLHHGAGDFEDDVTIVLCRRVPQTEAAGEGIRL